jgi:ribosomal protein L16/L10AE
LKFLKKFAGIYYGVCGLKFKLLIFPDFWLTAKPKETRMGKGKGAISKKIYRLRTGSTILEFFYSKESYLFCIHLLQKIRLKLPVKNTLIHRFW